MALKKEGLVLAFGIIALVILVTVLAFFIEYNDPLQMAERLFALYGLLMLSIATIMTPFLKEIKKIFGEPFIRVHHVFAILGIVFATAHPIVFAIDVMSILVFLPRFDSWYVFWSLGGRLAIYILYFAAIIALLRRGIKTYWRPMHALMYIVLFLAIVHGNLIGTDFQNLAVMVIFNLLFAVSMVAFVLKRVQGYQRKRSYSRKTS